MKVLLWVLAAAGVGALFVLPVLGPGPRPPPTWAESELTVRDVAPTGGLDATFLVAADTHFGAGLIEWKRGGAAVRLGDMASLLRRMVVEMRGIAGRSWPPEIGGVVARPRGVLVAGDLTDNGSPDEWEQFAKVFGGPEGGGALPWPSFVSVGNHDGYGGRYLARMVADRHGGVHYSWDWDDLHLISLGEAPDYLALRWLMRDLAATGRERPIVIFLHLPLAGPMSGGNWFGDGDYREHLLRVLEPFNVVAIFHGHWHASGHYEWAGIPVFNVGSAKHGFCDFLVVRVTDDRIAVAARNWYDEPHWWWWQARPTGRNRAADTEGLDVRPGDIRRPMISYPR